MASRRRKAKYFVSDGSWLYPATSIKAARTRARAMTRHFGTTHHICTASKRGGYKVLETYHPGGRYGYTKG